MSLGKCSGRSVGAIIKKNNKVLLLERVFFPLGWAPPGGHIDKGELPKAAVIREIREETGLIATSCRLLTKGKRVKDLCWAKRKYHDWWMFECQYKGRVRLDKGESKKFRWFPVNKIKNNAKITDIWQYWFGKIKI